MGIEIVRSDRSTPENVVWKFMQDGSQILHLEIDDRPLWGIAWYTTIPTKKGLDAIRRSYRGLKEIFQETRQLQEIGRVPDGLFAGFMTGPVHFMLEGHNAPSDGQHIAVSGRPLAVALPHFMNPYSFDNGGHGRNPLYWIRVDTEYLSYFFEGEGTPLHNEPSGSAMDPPKFPSREFGLLGNNCAVDEVLQLFQNTSSTKFEAHQLTIVHQTLEGLLETFPKFSERSQ